MKRKERKIKRKENLKNGGLQNEARQWKEKSKGKTILITTHIMSFVDEMADEIVFILDGKIYFKGTVEELKTQTNNTNLEHAIANLIAKQYA